MKLETEPRREGETEPQYRWRIEQNEQDRRVREARLARNRERLEWDRETKQREEAEAAEKKRQTAELLRKQEERQRNEAAETKRLQDAARAAGTPLRLSTESVQAWETAQKAKNTAPDREVSCPACRQSVKLVDGALPHSHTVRHRDEWGAMETVTCLCYSGRVN
jgi:hypothetical protein